MSIIHYTQTLEFCATKHSPKNSRFVWTFSGSNRIILPMLTILLIPLKITTQYQMIGEGEITVASL